MDLKQPWMLYVLIPLVLLALVVFSLDLFGRRRGVGPNPHRLAHSDRVRRLPRFQAVARREVIIAELLTVGAVLTCFGAILLAARPQSTTVSQESQANRDIVLCLDASSSMFDENVEVLESYGEIAKNLDGERISLVIWSEAAVTVFPLTDDHRFIAEQLATAREAMASQDPAFVEGTYLGTRASAIGDGLVSCVDTFDLEDEDRGRAIVLASDNDPQGKPPIFSLPEASKYASDNDVRVYGIGSPDLEYDTAKREEFEKAVTDTGGTFDILGSDGSTDEIVDDIQELEATRIKEPPQIVVNERPAVPLTITGLGVLVLLSGWIWRAVIRLRGAR